MRRARCSSTPPRRLPGARRRREPARPDGPAPGGARRRVRRSPPGPTGSSARGCSTCSGCRARGWSWPGSPGPGASRRPLADLLVRAAGDRRAGHRPGAAGLGPGEVGACKVSPRWPTWRRDLLAPGRRDPAQLAGRGAAARPPLRRRPGTDPRRPQRRRSSVRRRRRRSCSARSTARATSSSTSAGSSRGRTCWG